VATKPRASTTKLRKPRGSAVKRRARAARPSRKVAVKPPTLHGSGGGHAPAYEPPTFHGSGGGHKSAPTPATDPISAFNIGVGKVVTVKVRAVKVEKVGKIEAVVSTTPERQESGSGS
jgi:hypothetical protein